MRIHRSPSNGLFEKACESCIQRHTPKCEVCLRQSRPVGTVEGRAACKSCVARNTLLDGTCSNCGKHSRAPNTGACLGCRDLRLAEGIARHCKESLSSDWAKELFEEFVKDSGVDKNPGSVGKLMKRSIEGFRLLETAFDSKQAITALGVFKAFSSQDSTNRRFRAVKAWLSTVLGLDFSGPSIERARHDQRIQKMLGEVGEQWIGDAVSAMLAELYHRRNKRLLANAGRGTTPMALKSVELAVRYALAFLRYCHSMGARSPSGVAQWMADAYASSRSKVYQSLGAFIRYLNRTSHRLNQLVLPSRPGPKNSILNTLESSKVAELVGAWLDTRDEKDVRNAVIALLIVLHAQRLNVILDLKLSQVQDQEQRMSIDFGGLEMEVHPEVAAVVRAWLEVRTEPSRFRSGQDSPFLFPGYQPGTRYSEPAFNTWLKEKHGVRATQLFATSVHGFIEGGLDGPAGLVSGLGLSSSTATKYWLDSGRDLSSFLYAESLQLLRKRGLLDR